MAITQGPPEGGADKLLKHKYTHTNTPYINTCRGPKIVKLCHSLSPTVHACYSIGIDWQAQA